MTDKAVTGGKAAASEDKLTHHLAKAEAKQRGRGRPGLGRYRVMVPMEPAVLAIFREMSEASGVPLGRSIADWCRDTADGAQYVMQKVKEARSSPKRVLAEMELHAEGMLEEVRAITGQRKR